MEPVGSSARLSGRFSLADGRFCVSDAAACCDPLACLMQKVSDESHGPTLENCARV